MIDPIDGNRQRSALICLDQSLGFQIPLMKIEMLVAAPEHFLQEEGRDASVLRILSATLLQLAQDTALSIRIVERCLGVDIKAGARRLYAVSPGTMGFVE